MDLVFDKQDLVKILFSILIGLIIGAEREYKSKTAGFKTICLICLGSTLFTIFSIRLGGATSSDRIASNILTGIGFIGAGVIFKDRNNLISGLTTAAVIWITAALGIGIGVGEYLLCCIAALCIIIVLTIFPFMEKFIDAFHQIRTYSIWINNKEKMDEIEEFIENLNLKVLANKNIRDGNSLTCTWSLGGKAANHDLFTDHIFNDLSIEKFQF
jgi:putative Mg2+ transporter-C (MgtC) family protein